jgi:3-(3-hydroxy-phenyl)propionate hydroxylase
VSKEVGSGSTRSALFQFAYHRSPDQDAGTRGAPARHAVVVVGAGPVGLSAAIDLALRGQSVLLLDDADRIGEGSRGICYAKRTLEIWDRLGAAEPMLAKGVEWQTGRVFQRGDEVYRFDLLPEGGHRMPAFINLQQYYVEKFLVERAATLPNLEIRWRNKVTALDIANGQPVLTIDTPDGPYRLAAGWLIAADGARSTIRSALGLDFEGEMFEDQFLIADVRMTAPFPTERWFWFDPPFHDGKSALLHKQPDDIWRIDLQLSPDADVVHERRPEVVRSRIARMLGHADFELEWVSVYRFQCRRIRSFVHGRVVFAGDSAHQVSPFGARGANSGVQDAENLAWKLDLVLRGEAPEGLIVSYDVERCQAADENIAHSTRSTDFIAPRTEGETRYRDAALALARRADWAKRYVNSGRLSTPTVYRSPLSTPDGDAFDSAAIPGAAMPDAPIADQHGRRGWLLGALGVGFTVLTDGDPGALARQAGKARVIVVGDGIQDVEALVRTRLDLRPGTTYVIRPDQHVAARLRQFDPAWISRAIARASGRS